MAKEIKPEYVLSDAILEGVIDSCIDKFTDEQKEYIHLKVAISKMMDEYKRLKDLRLIGCVTRTHNKPTKYFWESMFYEYLERLKEEQELI